MQACDYATDWSGRPPLIACLLVALLTAVGCGRPPVVAPAQGKVTYNGQPLKYGTVMFQPDKGGQPAQGEIRPDGTFVLWTMEPGDGARIGPNKVAVFCYESQDPSKAAERTAGEQSLGKLLIPAKYVTFNTSGLTAEVKPEANEPFVFELTDK